MRQWSSEIFLCLLFALGLIFYNQLLSQFFLISILVWITLGRFVMGTQLEIPNLILGSLFHFSYLLQRFYPETGTLHAWKKSFLMALILITATATFLILSQKFRRRIFPSWFFAGFIFTFIYFIKGLENISVPGLPFGISILIWPFLLNMDAIQKNEHENFQLSEFLLTLCPLWYVALFQNVPTEPGPAAFRRSLQTSTRERRSYGKKALGILGLSLGALLFLQALEWVLYGGYFLKLQITLFHPPWKILPQVDWIGRTSFFGFFLSVCLIVIRMFLQFIIISSAANAIALFLGFKMILNERLSYGLKMARSWNLLMHYLNHLAKTIFFLPAVQALKFIRKRQLRNFVAAIVTIYSFGLCYLAFLPYSRIFHPEGGVTQRFYDRCMYLILICAVAFFRIYGPRVNEKTWQGQFLKYLIPALLIPIMGMGVLSLSSLH
jgi:hypothetical protein